MIVGAGQGGSALYRILKQSERFRVEIIVDINEQAPGLHLARQDGVKTDIDYQNYLNDGIDIIIDVTGDPTVHSTLMKMRGSKQTIIPGSVAHLIVKLINDRELLIEQLKMKTAKDELIFNAVNDGMIIIDENGMITSYNVAAENIMGLSKMKVIGQPIEKIIPMSKLPQVLKTKKAEINQRLTFTNGKKVITTRIPIISKVGKVLGAFAVFKDVTEVVQLAEEITNLKEIQTMLEAIIQSSNDAISVVDEKGKGILINRAYTRLTGLTEKDVIGQPADTDIHEGESMHMQVLKTKEPVRGVKMRVGPMKREVIVNVAPIIVNNVLKGSVGVIHDMSEIQSLTRELKKAKEIIRSLEAKYTFDDIIGQSEEMQVAIEQARIGAKTPATVLLRGESGTGKELFAHAIHNESERRYGPFIRVNCAALSESLLESELFGYEEGAFSGAKRGGKRGLFEEAKDGSIFLDEIGELSLSTQAKLLRVLQEKEIVRVGGTKPVAINARIIAATNIQLEKEVSNGNFREDLYYRLNRIPIHIPPLRKRKEDIPFLCQKLIQKINHDYGRNVIHITDQALTKLVSYHWPGNVRELENILGRAIIFMKISENYIDEIHLPEFLQLEITPVNDKLRKRNNGGKSLQNLMEDYEKKIISETLIQNSGNRTKTANDLGISIRNLYYKMEKHSL